MPRVGKGGGSRRAPPLKFFLRIGVGCWRFLAAASRVSGSGLGSDSGYGYGYGMVMEHRHGRVCFCGGIFCLGAYIPHMQGINMDMRMEGGRERERAGRERVRGEGGSLERTYEYVTVHEIIVRIGLEYTS
jgi:hypothetical protein